MTDALFDRAIQMTDGGEILRSRDDVFFGHQGLRFGDVRQEYHQSVVFTYLLLK